MLSLAGTLIAAYGQVTGFGRIEVDKDETGLGRWTTMKFTTDGCVRRFVFAYRLKVPSTLKRRGLDWEGKTVCEQHYCSGHQPTSNPRPLFPIASASNSIVEVTIQSQNPGRFFP